MAEEKPKKFTDEIDPRNTVEHPGLIAFPHTIGSAIIKPEDQGKIKSKALAAMRQQTINSCSNFMDKCKLLYSRQMNWPNGKKYLNEFTR